MSTARAQIVSVDDAALGSERTLLAHAVYFGAPLDVHPGNFSHPAFRLLANVIVDLKTEAAAVDRASVRDRLRCHRNELVDLHVDADELIDGLCDEAGPANLAWHAKEVTHAYQVRTIQALFRRGVADAARDKDLSCLAERTKLGIDAIMAASGPPPSPVACAASIGVEKISFLWERRIAAGMINILDGDPGLGKSTITADIAARLTRGDALPGEEMSRAPCGVIFVSFEDHSGAVMVPRLMAAGADLSRVFIWNLESRPFNLRDSLAELEHVMKTNDARLVIVDPLMAALPSDLNAHRDQDVRSVLAPVSSLAERTGAAILLVRHLNKNTGGGAVYRGGGSIGIIGAARVGLLLARDPDMGEEDDGRRVLAVAKCNVARAAPPLRLRLVPALSPAPGIEVACIEWNGTAKVSADELVAPREDHTVIGRALELLRDLMKDGPIPAGEGHAALEANGISQRTEARAKERLGIVAKREGIKGKWWWHLPEQIPPSHSAKGVQ